MRTIHKYPLTASQTTVSTYEGARFLHVAEQHGRIVLWAEVEPLERECVRDVYVVPTGGEVPGWEVPTEYLGTVLVDDGAFVFHVYVRLEAPRTAVSS